MTEIRGKGAEFRSRDARRPRARPLGWIAGAFAVLLGAPLLFALPTFGLYHIPSASMRPTLETGDYIVAARAWYGLGRHSFPIELPFPDRRFFAREPRRGDVVVYRRPGSDVDFVGRVVGLPGDRVALVGGRLHINGALAPRREVEPYESIDDGRFLRAPQYVETLPEGREHRVIEAAGDISMGDEFAERAAPDGHYFILGDNRDNSADSRYFGFVPSDGIVGRVLFAF